MSSQAAAALLRRRLLEDIRAALRATWGAEVPA